MSAGTAEDFLLIERRGAAVILMLNRPERRNALSMALRQALLSRLAELMQPSDPCRVILLAGAGGNFCAGGDIGEMKKRSVLESRAVLTVAQDIFRTMVSGAKPVVCAVEGVAVGAGLSLVAASDYVVSAPDAQYASSFVRIGILPDAGLFWSLSQKVGAGVARRLLLGADEFDGEQALAYGLVNQIAPAGEVGAAAMAVAERIAQLPPVALALLKTALAGGCETFEQAYETEINLQPLLRRTQDHREAVKAFLEKRAPVFSGC